MSKSRKITHKQKPHDSRSLCVYYCPRCACPSLRTTWAYMFDALTVTMRPQVKKHPTQSNSIRDIALASIPRSCFHCSVLQHSSCNSIESRKMTTKAAAIIAFFAVRALAKTTNESLDSGLNTNRRLRRRVNEKLGATSPVHADKNDRNLRGFLSDRDLQERCILQGKLYGSYVGTYRNVEFLYQGVFTEGISQAQINLNILPSLEEDIVEGILPSFFACPGNEPTGLINGISPSEADSLSVGGA